MSMYFRCYGYFSFENEAVAKQNFELLTTREDNRYFYFPDELELVHETILFKTDGNFSAYRTCEETIDVVSEIAENALFGNVKIDEGDGEDAMWSWRTYAVSDKTVYREHTDTQKSYRFKGDLEFADEASAKDACKTLLTNSLHSIFTKFPPNQKVFADDKRLISFEGNVLKIDVHCPGNNRLFWRTRRLFNRFEYKGKLECDETFALRFIPDKSENSSAWVSNMNRDIFYRYTGSLTFQTTEEAENAFQKLVNDEKSLFKINAKNSFPLYVIGTKLIFDDIGSCHRKLFNETYNLIRQFAAIAQRGKVEGAFSDKETMDSFVVDRSIPSKVRKSIQNSLSIAKKKEK